jgi:hypothetical protein
VNDVSTKSRQRFAAKLLKVNDCLEWQGARYLTKLPYGRVTINKEVYPAHRVAHLLTTGEWPKVVRHKCDNPPCCNPDHLVSGDTFSNEADKYARGRDRHLVGEDLHHAKLTWTIIDSIRERFSSGEKIRSIADDLGLTYHMTWEIVNFKCWTSRTYIPKVYR